MHPNQSIAALLVMLLAVPSGMGGPTPASAAVGSELPDSGSPQRSPGPSPITPRLSPGSPLQPTGPDHAVLAAAIAAATAAQAFAALTKDSAATGTVPRQSDPSASVLLASVLNVDVLTTRASLGRVDVPSLLMWLGAVGIVSLVYEFAGSNVTDAGVARGQAVAAQADRNMAQYAPEIGRALDAELALSAALAGAVTDSIADIGSTDAGRSGLAQLRAGIAGTIGQTIDALAVSGIDAPWRQQRLSSLAAAEPQVAKVLNPEQCAAVRTDALQTGQRLDDPAAVLALAGFVAAMKC